MLAWVAAAASRCRRVDAVYVATGDPDIEAACAQCGIAVIETPSVLPSGTDRVAVAAQHVAADVVINLQADEPTLDAGTLDALVEAFQSSSVDFASLMGPLEPDELDDPNRVKVWCNAMGDAIAFSRTHDGRAGARLHVGVYAFRPARLRAFAALPPSRSEQVHRLEQLRALDQGWPIRMVETAWRGLAVDTPEDLARARAILSGPPGSMTSSAVTGGRA